MTKPPAPRSAPGDRAVHSAEPRPGKLCEPVLDSLGLLHGFAATTAQLPEDATFSRQVHGADVYPVETPNDPGGWPADALVSTTRGVTIGIVTADCVPILVSDESGQGVAAIHAGWRGVAAGVIESGLAALRARLGSPADPLFAAVGPAARGCCYEVDAPVREALERRHASELRSTGVLAPTRPGHYLLDLARLATRVLEREGIVRDRIGISQRSCTICHPARFASHRRDGAAAGRMQHFVRVGAAVGAGSRLERSDSTALDAP